MGMVLVLVLAPAPALVLGARAAGGGGGGDGAVDQRKRLTELFKVVHKGASPHPLRG